MGERAFFYRGSFIVMAWMSKSIILGLMVNFCE